ncbi:MAG: alpha/beta hydrolase [Candidatus Eremiobacterota bacterium]
MKEPVPVNISKEAKDFLINFKNDFCHEEYKNPLKVRERREKYNLFLQMFLKAYGNKLFDHIEEKKIGNIPVSIITPVNYDSSRDDKIAIYTFGGAYYFGTPVTSLSAGLAFELGIKVCAIDYRLGPEHSYPAALEDSFSVYREIIKDFNSKNIVWLGDSAGGHLALTTLLKAQNEGLPLPAAAGLCSPWTEAEKLSDTYFTLDGYDPVLSYDGFIKPVSEEYFKGHNTEDPLVSPVYGTYSKNFPPVIITTGTRDLLLSDSVRLQRQMKRCGIKAELNVWEGMWHVFESFGYPFIPEAKESMVEIASFLGKELCLTDRK